MTGAARRDRIHMLPSLRSTLGRLVPRGTRLLAGVSGGADSVALALGLARLAPEFALTVALGHVNHGLRGAESDGDQAWVEALARQLGLAFHGRRVDAAAGTGDGVSLEMSCRTLRRAALAEMAAEAGCPFVALAHHRRDQAETVLLRLCRGGSPRGLGGMAPLSRHHGLSWVRPLLDMDPRELRAWLVAESQGWREDSSNLSLDPRRNRIRHEILPLLESRVNPASARHLAELAELARAEDEIVADALERVRPALSREGGGDPSLDLEAVRAQPAGLQRRWVSAWLEEHGLPAGDLSFALIERLRGLDTAKSGEWHLSRGLRLRWDAGANPVLEALAAACLPSEWLAPLPAFGTLVLPGGCGRVTADPGVGFERVRRSSPLHRPSRLHLSAGRAGASTLALRAWRHGDVIETHAGATLKIQDLFTDQKVPRSARSSIPIVVDGDRVVAVPGGWIARGWQVEHETAPCLRVTFAPRVGET